jgi:alanyl-tRNA synthetase
LPLATGNGSPERYLTSFMAAPAVSSGATIRKARAMNTMSTHETIQTFTGFFRERGHQLIPASSLVTSRNDPVLFTSAGMHPLTPYLEGRPHPLGRRLVSVQRCLRTTDLDEVGDPWHLTVFEMLGSWSLGDYAGPQSLRWGYELIRDGFGIGPDRLYATAFGGDEQVGMDTELLDVWSELGIPVELTRDENWWSNGPTGLCGPDSELFVWTGSSSPQGTPGSDERWLELWNHVMMRYRRRGDGTLEQLAQLNVDTGMGLERLLTILQEKGSVFECDLFEPWMSTLRELWDPDQESLRLLADHLRSVTVIIGDGVRPSNTGRGYVLRRLVRRALTMLWRVDSSRTLSDLPAEVMEQTLGHFGQATTAEVVRGVLREEERRFAELLVRGRQVISRRHSAGPPSEEELSYLHETHGLPRELVLALMSEAG